MTRREDRDPATIHVLRWLGEVRDAELSTAAKAVALVMATFGDYGTGANMRAGMATLAARAGLGVRRCREAVAELRSVGLIAWDGVPTAPGRARVYTLTIPAERRHSGAAVKGERRHSGAAVKGQRRHSGAAERRHYSTVTAAPECHPPRPRPRAGDDAAPGGASSPSPRRQTARILPLAEHVKTRPAAAVKADREAEEAERARQLEALQQLTDSEAPDVEATP